MAPKRKRDEVEDMQTRAALHRMYETGEWSDLIIESCDCKLFRVHKTVVCPAVPFFHAACTNGMAETFSNHVKLPERSAVVELMLWHLYEFSMQLRDLKVLDRHDRPRGCFDPYCLIDLRVAIDKYQIASMVAPTERLYFSALKNADGLRLAKLANTAFRLDGDCLENMRQRTVEEGAQVVPAWVEEDNECWQLLGDNMEYLRRTIKAFAERRGAH